MKKQKNAAAVVLFFTAIHQAPHVVALRALVHIEKALDSPSTILAIIAAPRIVVVIVAAAAQQIHHTHLPVAALLFSMSFLAAFSIALDAATAASFAANTAGVFVLLLLLVLH
jgi:hypothetical protein